MKQKEKNNKVRRMFNPYVIDKTSTSGITLVALVVTIIVLIILAGVSINLILGDNGLITKANEAKQVQEMAELKEKIKLQIAVKQMEKLENSNGITQSEVEEILLEYGTVNKDSEGKIESLKPTGKDFEIPYEEIVDDKILVSDEEDEEQINLYFGGVYSGMLTLTDGNNDISSIETAFSFLKDGTTYQASNFFMTGNIGSYDGLDWNEKNENMVSYSDGNIVINGTINIEVSENGESFTVPKEILTAVMISGGDGSIYVKEDVTFTYTGEQFEEHEPYKNTKYYFTLGFKKGDYIELKDDGSFELYLVSYPQYCGVYEYGEIDVTFEFSLDGKVVSGFFYLEEVNGDFIGVEENSVILYD